MLMLALTPLRVDTQRIAEGATFLCTAAQASFLTSKGWARLADGADPNAADPAPVAVPRYLRGADGGTVELVAALNKTVPGTALDATQAGALLALARLAYARNPDALISGAVTRDANGAATSAPVTWPDGTPGTYTATTVSTAFPGAVDAYTVTYGSPATKTYTQPTITRDAAGAATNVPAITVS